MPPFERMIQAFARLAAAAASSPAVRSTTARGREIFAACRRGWGAFLQTDFMVWSVGRLRLVEAWGQRLAEQLSDVVLAGRESSWPGWTGSIALHLLMLVSLVVLSLLRPTVPQRSTAFVPVDLVQVTDQTNVAPMARPAPRFEPFSQTSPIVLKTLNVQMLPLPQINSLEESAPSEAVESDKQDGMSERPTEKVLQEDKPQREDASSQIVPDSVTHVLPTPTAPANARPSQRLVQAEGPSTAATASLMAILHSQIVACWSPPPAAPRPEQYAVDFVLRLNPNGTIAQPPQFVDAVLRAAPHDPAVRAAADAARRALYACAPYKLPGDLYGEWREINPFHFDPGAFITSTAGPAR
jgi:hypothetical protein